jgi:hypothetical protein
MMANPKWRHLVHFRTFSNKCHIIIRIFIHLNRLKIAKFISKKLKYTRWRHFGLGAGRKA